MNAENFAKVIAAIDADPSSWDQIHWHSWCMTTHCFAGHAQILSGAPLKKREGGHDFSSFAGSDAIRWLDLTDYDADYLFNPCRTMDDFRDFLKLHQALADSARAELRAFEKRARYEK